MTLAVGATQALMPGLSVRQQLARMAAPQRVSPEAAPAELASIAPPPLAAVPHTHAVGPLGPGAGLKSLPPRTTIAARRPQPTRLGRCLAPPAGSKPAQSVPLSAATASAFGRKLARAARAQTADLVVYTDRYRQIGFPMGDVPSFYGVCTDVVVRAYRALGIDLQELVHKARIGTGDTSIDHRRTKTLRRFFKRYGVSLPVTDFTEDYRPGDIVTYHRPSGRTSQSHIAIVADVIAPSGRPMIVHNRGWGPQLEDALFANAITGHYRFTTGRPHEQARAAADDGPPARVPLPKPKPRVHLSANGAQ